MSFLWGEFAYFCWKGEDAKYNTIKMQFFSKIHDNPFRVIQGYEKLGSQAEL